MEVNGIDGLKKLVIDSQPVQVQAQPAREPERTQIKIMTWDRNTTIDISLSSVADLPAALSAIGYCKRPGILQKVSGWLFPRAAIRPSINSSEG